MSHYYINDPSLKEEKKQFVFHYQGIDYKFVTNTGVFSRDQIDYGSRVLIDAVALTSDDKKIIDMGAGYGAISIVLAKLNPDKQFFLYDINEKACELAKENAKLNNLTNITVTVSNLFEKVKETADVIVSNPPIRAGKETVFKIYEDAYEKLNINGRFYCVIQKKQGAPSSYKKLEELFKKVAIITKNKGYWIICGQK